MIQRKRYRDRDTEIEIQRSRYKDRDRERIQRKRYRERDTEKEIQRKRYKERDASFWPSSIIDTDPDPGCKKSVKIMGNAHKIYKNYQNIIFFKIKIILLFNAHK